MKQEGKRKLYIHVLKLLQVQLSFCKSHSSCNFDENLALVLLSQQEVDNDFGPNVHVRIDCICNFSIHAGRFSQLASSFCTFSSPLSCIDHAILQPF